MLKANIKKFLILFPLWLNAEPFQIINRTSDLDASNPAHAVILDALNAASDDMESVINNGFLSETSQTNFTTSMSKATTSSSSSLIADRGANQSAWIVRVGAQGAFNSATGTIPSDSSTDNSLPSFGVSGQATVTIGINAAKLGVKKLGPFDPKRTTFLMNGFYFTKGVSDIAMTFFNAGLNAQYKLVTPKGKSALLTWGGLDFLTGVNFQSLTVDYSSNITQRTTETVGGESASISVNMDYTLGVKSLDVFVPLEISTNVRFLYMFTLYAGLSADFNFGKNYLTGSASGPITAQYSTPVPGVDNLYSATGDLNLEGGITQSPTLLVGRGFAGLQLHLWELKLGFEGTALTNGTLGGAVNLRTSM